MTQHNRSETLLSIADLARNLALPESTTRYYCNRFAAHLPSTGDGRRRRYKPEALGVLHTIAESMRRNKNAFAVDLALRDGQPPAASTVPAIAHVAASPMLDSQAFGPGALTGQIMSLMERQTQALQEIAGAMTVFAAKIAVPGEQPVIPAKAAPTTARPTPLAALPASEETETLREEVTALRQQVRSAEDVHQNDLEQMRKWLARLSEAMAKR